MSIIPQKAIKKQNKTCKKLETPSAANRQVSSIQKLRGFGSSKECYTN